MMKSIRQIMKFYLSNLIIPSVLEPSMSRYCSGAGIVVIFHENVVYRTVFAVVSRSCREDAAVLLAISRISLDVFVTLD